MLRDKLSKQSNYQHARDVLCRGSCSNTRHSEVADATYSARLEYTRYSPPRSKVPTPEAFHSEYITSIDGPRCHVNIWNISNYILLLYYVADPLSMSSWLLTFIYVSPTLRPAAQWPALNVYLRQETVQSVAGTKS